MHLPWDRHPDERRLDDRRLAERRAEEHRDDFGQADYSRDYAYDPDRRAGYRADRVETRDDDYGQTDVSRDYAYDPEARTGYRRGPDDPDESRSWRGREPHIDRETRRGRERLAVDRRILAIISERLERDRRIDSSDVEITVDEGVVYLTGTTRTREGKRRIEHMADIEGVADVVNGLRVREPEQRRNMFGF